MSDEGTAQDRVQTALTIAAMDLPRPVDARRLLDVKANQFADQRRAYLEKSITEITALLEAEATGSKAWLGYNLILQTLWEGLEKVSGMVEASQINLELAKGAIKMQASIEKQRLQALADTRKKRVEQFAYIINDCPIDELKDHLYFQDEANSTLKTKKPKDDVFTKLAKARIAEAEKTP